MRIYASLLVLFTVIIQACERAPRESVHIHALYHWTSYFDRYSLRDFNDSVRMDHLFIRLFDIKYNPVYGAYPEAKLSIRNSYRSEYDFVPEYIGKTPISYTPVVYIEEKALRLLNLAEVDSLASDLVKQVNFMTEKMQFKGLDELQIDCDWTTETKNKYFRLLEGVKGYWKLKLSVTVKMYQYKYREKMGIPPADRAVLMCYNLEDLKDSATENSIFRKSEFDRYMTRNNYPLPLDFALPAFSWARIYKPMQQVYLSPEFTLRNLEYYKHDTLSANSFRVKAWDPEMGEYYPENTLIKFDAVDRSDWEHIYQKSLKHINSDTTRYIYYHLSSNLKDELQSYLADSVWHAAHSR